MRTRIMSLVLLVGLVVGGLTGCGAFFGDGRMKEWSAVRKEEEKTKQEVAKAIGREADAKKQSTNTRNPTLKLTSYDKDGKVTSTAEMDLQPVVAEITGGRANYAASSIPLNSTPIPKGEFAENFEAGAEGTAKVLSSPGTIALGITYNERKRNENSGKNTINGETVNIEDSLNKVEEHATGYGNQLNHQGTADPTVVQVPATE